MHVHMQDVAFAFAEAAPILEAANFTLSVGWTGLVGANGAGKTTLLRLLSGELRPTRGQVRLTPKELRVEWCAQELPEPTPSLAAFAQSHERLAHRLRASLRLQALERWTTLSPGERKRWQIGAAIAAEPDVLLLDEPTNHIDGEARRWLLEALRLHEGIGLLVSHDRALLDALTSQTLRLADATAVVYAGGYTRARAAWEQELQQQRDARAAAHAHVRRVSESVQVARRAQQGAAAQKKASARMKNKYDSDARGMLHQVKADWADATHGRKLEVRRRELERAEAALGELHVKKQLGSPVFADFAPAPSEIIGFREEGPLCVGERCLAELPALTLRRRDRIWLAGSNGAGKSTLLRALAQALRLARAEVLIMPQELSPERTRESLHELQGLARSERGRVLSIVAGLGVEPERLLSSEQPSPGEARKLLLALGFARQARALVLDEPENHLDVPSIERMEAAILNYPGALFLVTHDAELARACTSQRWLLREGKLQVSPSSSDERS